MKASEIQPKGKIVPAKKDSVVQPVMEKAASKKSTVHTSAPSQPVFGVDDPDGHVIKRIRHSKPLLWHKIQNWD